MACTTRSTPRRPCIATIDEVKALYPGLHPIQETVVAGQRLLFNDFELTPSQVADITLFVGATAGVTVINLMFAKEGGKVGGTIIRDLPGSVPATARRGIFDDMKKLLLEKYGTPKSDEKRMEGSFERTTILWLFPLTSIELRLSQSVRYAQLGNVAITYRIVGKNPL